MKTVGHELSHGYRLEPIADETRPYCTKPVLLRLVSTAHRGPPLSCRRDRKNQRDQAEEQRGAGG